MNDAGKNGRNPFPGLRPFKESEEHLFFGRESQVDAMVDKLAATRFLAVVGTSGSGKSSLVNCGLRPALHAGLMASAGTTWRVAKFRPGGAPLRAMADALSEDGVLFKDYQPSGMTLTDVVDTTLRMSRLGLIDIYEQARLESNVNLLVVVDQFEELFRYKALGSDQGDRTASSSEEATALVNLLLEASRQTNHPIYIVLTMRSDFLGDCAQFGGLAEAINAGQYLVPRLTRDERRSAISGPIGVGGAEISPVLLTRLVNDVGDNPDQLSILQHSLNRTWAHWQSEGGEGPLDLEHYAAIGTMAHALDYHAEEAYAELATTRQKEICEKLFRALTDRATDSRGVRRPTTLGTLCALADATQAEVTNVIDVFREPSRSFLMPPVPDSLHEETIIDISHESLMRVWERLTEWSYEEEIDAERYRRLVNNAELYDVGDLDPLAGSELKTTREWWDRVDPNEAWANRYQGHFEQAKQFLLDSEAHERRVKRSRRAVRLAMVGICSILLAATGYQALLFQTERANQASASSTAATLMRNAMLVDADPQLASLLAVEAIKATRDSYGFALDSAQQVLRDVVSGFSGGIPLSDHTARIRALAVSPDSSWVLTGSSDNTARLWNLRDSRPNANALELRGHEGEVRAVAFSQDNRWVVTAGNDTTARLWDRSGIDPRQTARVFSGHTSEIRSVAISRNNRWLVTGSSDSTARLWDLEDPDPNGTVVELIGHEQDIYAVAITPDGRWVVTGSDDMTARLWDLNLADPNESVRVLSGGEEEGRIRTLAVSSDSRWLVTGTETGTARLWDLTHESPDETSQLLQGHERPVNSVLIGPNNRWLVTASDDATARLWDLNNDVPGTNSIVLSGHEDAVWGLAISHDGQWLVTGADDNTARLWDLTADDPGTAAQVLRGHTDRVRSVAISQDGDWLVTASDDSIAQLWDLTDDGVRADTGVLSGHADEIWALAISPDNRWLVTGSDDDTARVWDLTVDNPSATVRVLRGHRAEIRAVTFSPDGRLLVTASNDATARLWDLSQEDPNQNFTELLGHVDAIYAVVVSPDSRSLVTGSDDATARLWDLSQRDPNETVRVFEDHADRIRVAAISRDGRWLATGSDDNTARLWDLTATGANSAAKVLSGHESSIGFSSMAISADNRWLVTGSNDSTARVWDLDLESADPSENPRVLRGHTGEIWAVAISPDSRWLVTGSNDSTARIWDLSALDPEASVRVLRDHDGWITALAISHDSRWLATGSFDRTTRLWNLTADDPGATSFVLRGHSEAIRAVTVSPNNRWVATSSNDNTARLWELQLDDLVDHAGRIAGRNLTPAEWDEFDVGESYRATFREFHVIGAAE